MKKLKTDKVVIDSIHQGSAVINYHFDHTGLVIDSIDVFHKTTERQYFSIPVGDIELIASQATGIPVEDLMLKEKTERIVFARWLVWDYIKKYKYPFEFDSLKMIGGLYGKNHATVLHGIKALANKQVGWRAESQKFFNKKIAELINDERC